MLKEQGRVVASFDKRRDLIREQVEQQARMHEAVAIIDEALLDEVTSLVEFLLPSPAVSTKHFWRFHKKRLFSP